MRKLSVLILLAMPLATPALGISCKKLVLSLISTTERVRLRPVQRKHVAALDRIQRDPLANKMEGTSGAPPAEGMVSASHANLAYIAREGFYDQWNYLVFAIETNESREFLGYVVFSRGADGTFYVGYRLASSAWGQGYMTEALTKAIGVAFNRFQIQELRAHVWENNPASIQVLKNAGFSQTGAEQYVDETSGEVFEDLVFAIER